MLNTTNIIIRELLDSMNYSLESVDTLELIISLLELSSDKNNKKIITEELTKKRKEVLEVINN